MPKKKKPFIDRKNAVSFHLVHRSQQDPLVVDEKAPHHVLLPATNNLQGDSKKQKEELLKYGIYFDDDYNYLQHLEDCGGSGRAAWEQTIVAPAEQQARSKLNLPSSVFASGIEENVGLLNKAAPQSGLRLDLDPDIVAAMDEDFDFSNPENELEDNFVELAKGDHESLSEDKGQYFDADSDKGVYRELSGDEEQDELASWEREETKSRFTEYSMTSSVMRRNQQLTLLDDRFEEMFAQYDECEIGALDCEEIEGNVESTSEVLLQCADEFERENSRVVMNTEPGQMLLHCDSSEDEDQCLLEVQPKERWDCESIISTYSNLYNHPHLISAPPSKIRVSHRTGLPVGMTGARLTVDALSRQQSGDRPVRLSGPGSLVSAVTALSIRPKSETAEGRRQRKAALKQFRKERRAERKMNKEAFKEEKRRMEKMLVNNMTNLQSIVHL